LLSGRIAGFREGGAGFEGGWRVKAKAARTVRTVARCAGPVPGEGA
jgi:hypothetical protein